MKLIDKEALVAKIEKLRKNAWESFQKGNSTEEQYYIRYGVIQDILFFLEDEVKDPYEQCVQYDSIKAGIQAHAETYSFNIESKLFNQLTKEQQELWRKEIEQACISGGDAGYSLARDPRYKENLEMKEVNLEKEYEEFVVNDPVYNKLVNGIVGKAIAKYFYSLGLKAQKRRIEKI